MAAEVARIDASTMPVERKVAELESLLADHDILGGFERRMAAAWGVERRPPDVVGPAASGALDGPGKRGPPAGMSA